MPELSSLSNKRLGPTSIPATGIVTVVGSVDLAALSDGDSMFLVRANCLAFRIATTTAYPETALRSVAVTRVSGVYSISPLIEGFPTADNDIGPTSYGNVIGGVYTDLGAPGQVVFSLSLSGSSVVLSAKNDGATATKARGYLQIMVCDP